MNKLFLNLLCLACLGLNLLKAESPLPLAQWKAQESTTIQNSLADPNQAKKDFLALAQEVEKQLLQQGVEDANLFYNCGNLYYFGEDMAKSITNFRKAEELNPSDLMIQKNLNSARSERIDQLPKHFGNIFQQSLYSLIDDLPDLYLCIAGVLSLTLAVLYGLIQSKTNSLFWPCAFLGTLTFFLITLELFQQLTTKVNSDLVITAAEVLPRKGPGLIFSEAFNAPLHAGTELRFIEAQERWSYVQLSDGRECWLPQRSFVWVKKP
jgi:tetratricopeptide (TPR) repeat protein